MRKEKLIVSFIIVMLFFVSCGNAVLAANNVTTITANTSNSTNNTTNNTANNTTNNTSNITNNTTNNTSNNSSTYNNTSNNSASTNNTSNNTSSLPYTGSSSYKVVLVVIVLVISAMYAYKKVTDYDV